MVLGQAVCVAIVAVTALAVDAQQTYLLSTSEALRLVGLLHGDGGWEFWDLERRCLLDHFFFIDMLSEFRGGYL